MIWILDHQEILSLMLIFHFLLYALHHNMEYVIILCFTEEAREIKNCSEISTLSRKRLHGSRAGPLSGCTLWYCGNKCKQSLCFYWICPFLTTWFDECGNFLFQGLDMGRRLCIIGFCRSIEMLSDVVEDTVLEHGGEVWPFKSILCSIWLLQLQIWCFHIIVVWSVASTKVGLRLHQTYHCWPYYFLWRLL